VDSETIKQIEAENKRLGEVFDKNNPPPAETEPEVEELKGNIHIVSLEQKQSFLRAKYKRDRNDYIRNPENRTTPYPIRNRMRCWLKAPQKVYAIWNTPPEANKEVPLWRLADLIVFPEGY
jgi:hypothetical protein